MVRNISDCSPWAGDPVADGGVGVTYERGLDLKFTDLDRLTRHLVPELGGIHLPQVDWK